MRRFLAGAFVGVGCHGAVAVVACQDDRTAPDSVADKRSISAGTTQPSKRP